MRFYTISIHYSVFTNIIEPNLIKDHIKMGIIDNLIFLEFVIFQFVYLNKLSPMI